MSYPTLNDSYQRLRLRRVATLDPALLDALQGEPIYETSVPLAYIMRTTTGAATPATHMPIGANMPYGSMFLRQADSDINVVIGTPSIWYAISSGLIGGEELLTAFQNAREIEVQMAGHYEVNWSMALSTNAANDEVMGAAGVNGAALEEAANRSTVATPSAFVSVAGHAIIDVEADDLISLFVQNESAARDIDIQHVTCTVKYLGT